MSFADNRHRASFVWLLVAESALILATWPIWFATEDFPRVALIELPFEVSPWCDRSIAVLLLLLNLWIGWAVSRPPGPQADDFRRRSRLRYACVLLLIFGGVLAALDVVRMQPWHWLFLLIVMQTAVLRGQESRRLFRLTLATIYIFAALSRLRPPDPEFIGPTRTIVDTLLQFVSANLILKNPTAVARLELAMNVVELIAGFTLLFSSTRRFGIVLVLGIHCSLLLALGPWGLNHSNGVLIWNVYLLVAVPLLFWRTDPANSSNIAGSTTVAFRISHTLLIAVPLAALFSYVDAWMGWQVYSARPDRVYLLVIDEVATRLPESCQRYVMTPRPLQEYRRVRVDRWATELTMAPLYPDDRYQLAVLDHVLPEDVTSGFVIDVVTAETPLWWRSKTVRISDRKQLKRHRQSFLLPSEAR